MQSPQVPFQTGASFTQVGSVLRGEIAGGEQGETFSLPAITLNKQEISRKLWHMSAGLLPFICPLLPYYDCAASFWGPGNVRLMILGATAVLVGLSCVHSHKFARANEKNAGVAMSWYVFCVTSLLLAFPDHLEYGMTVLAILAIGDGAAGVVGMSLRGPKLPWNPTKTVSGTVGFALFAIPAATAAFWCSSFPGVSWEYSLKLASVACVVAALAESWPSTINDNLRVGASAAAVLMINHWMR